MNPMALQYTPLLIAIDTDTPRVSVARAPSVAELAAVCDRILAMPPANFPRQGVSYDVATMVAKLVRRLL